MSMKEELEIWVTALQRYDAQEFEEAITVFQPICDTAKIHFNCGVIRATLGEHEAAVHHYQSAIELDQFFAIAYYQMGVSYFLLDNFEHAIPAFNTALHFMRLNKYIDYDQLGLKFKLWTCEIMFNRGLCYIYLMHDEVGMVDIQFAQKEKAVPEHDVIDEAIKDKAAGYTVFSIPVGLVFRPNEAKVKNIEARNYLGKARLVAQASRDTMHRRDASMNAWVQDDRPADQISYAATHLVRPNLRTRQQSEPPLQRNMFPPTPPPEPEKERTRRQSPDRNGGSSRSQSLSRKPEPLNLGATSFTSPAYGGTVEQSRRAPARSASERPSERRPMPERRTSDHNRLSSQSTHSNRHKLFGSIDHGEQQADVMAQLAQTTISPRSQLQRRHTPQNHDLIQEEEEDDAPYDIRSSTSTFPEVRDDTDTRSIYSTKSRRGPPAMQKIRVKVHANDDTRYIMLQPQVTILELIQQVAKKFGITTGLKLKTRDEEGDMITMGDQDDLEMAIGMCKEVAARERSEMGKIELWVQSMQH